MYTVPSNTEISNVVLSIYNLLGFRYKKNVARSKSGGGSGGRLLKIEISGKGPNQC